MTHLLPPCAISHKHVVIAGGGIGGLTTALAILQGCENNHVEPPASLVIVEQARDRRERREQVKNHSISIRADTGAAQVLDRLGLMTTLQGTTSVSQAFYMAKTAGVQIQDLVEMRTQQQQQHHHHHQAGLRLMRMDFWEVLVDAVEKNAAPYVRMQWNSQITNIQVLPNTITLHLANSTTLNANLVIVSDGVRSPIRKILLPQERLRFAGACFVGGLYHRTSPTMPPVPKFIHHRHGMVFFNDGQTMAWVAHESEDEVMWGLSWASPVPWDVRRDDLVVLRERANTLAARSGNEDIMTIVRLSRDETLWCTSCFDKLPNRSVDGRVVFIGDACHAVTPFSGNGAGMAIVDAETLAKLLTAKHASHPDLSTVLAEFDNEMVARTTRGVKQGRFAIDASLYSTSTLKQFRRNTLLRVLALIIQRPKTVLGLTIVGVVGAVLGITVGIFGKRPHNIGIKMNGWR